VHFRADVQHLGDPERFGVRFGDACTGGGVSRGFHGVYTQ
jgi:hypothetical protein